MLVACNAWEGLYQGLHGIESTAILEVSDIESEYIKEIDEWGNVESEDLIYSYGLEEEYKDEMDFMLEEGECEEDEYDITYSSSYCDRGWTAFKVKDSAVAMGVNKLDELIARLGFDYFVEMYCEGLSLV